MQKKVVAFMLVLCFASVTVFAQSPAQVSTWLNQALSKSNQALRLARSRNIDSNLSQIQSLSEEIKDIILKVKNWADRRNSFTSDQREKWDKLMANMNEINERVMNSR